MSGLKWNQRFIEEEEWSKRDLEIRREDGEVIFEMKDAYFPDSWSRKACNIVASKYFHGSDEVGKYEQETSLGQLVGRVVEAIVDWGKEQGYFYSAKDAIDFEEDLYAVLVTQRASFNSPVWFNIGVDGRRQQASACYINSLEDSMEDILELVKTEGIIFKYGSGAGVNVSKLRAEGEPLSGGGYSSGPLSFMKTLDANAGAIKSGGTCLAGDQLVWTEKGPKKVSELVGEEFIVLSYDPPSQRVKAKNATASEAGEKSIVEIKTDKGVFRLSEDHPVFMADREKVVSAGNLEQGSRILQTHIGNDSGYLRVRMLDEPKGRDSRYRVHDLIADDLLNRDPKSVVHHIDGNRRNNSLDNIELMSQSEHASLHGKEIARKGEHIFQKKSFPRAGKSNPMHKSSDFWKDEEKVRAYKDKQRSNISSDRARRMQRKAPSSRMLNFGFKLLGRGHSLETFEDYCEAREKEFGRIASKKKLRKSINNWFGSYSNFIDELNSRNHRVLEVKSVGIEDVYDVHVECPTPDDKSPESGHNFLIWSCNNEGDEGSGIFVFNTRRAALMRILDVDHPDVVKFIKCKGKEEEKAHALIEAGYDSRLDGEAYGSVFFQNSNNSVMVTDEFMEAVENDETVDLVNRTNGEVADCYPARDILRFIAEETWACGDPGVMFYDKINQYNTCPNSGEIRATNPCGEYIWHDDTSCNLASINLLKFVNDEGEFDLEGFNHTVRLMITAMDILCGNADYPTEQLTERTLDFRTLGLGFSNLGATLMVMGYPYDSDVSRSFASAISANMTSTAYFQSAVISAIKEPFPVFLENSYSMVEVLRRQARSVGSIDGFDEFKLQAIKTWDEAIDLGSDHGFRNAQVTCIAPTGTISFMMDCDTTGIEPAIALRSYKTMVGGGTVPMTIEALPKALRNLEYNEEVVESCLESVKETGNLEGEISAYDLQVFECAFPNKEEGRSLPWQAHLDMVAAVQPHITLGISKTINMPSDSTVEDIEQAYIEAWEKGLKNVSIYRDGSKRSQPLSTKQDSKEEDSEKKWVQFDRPFKEKGEQMEVTLDNRRTKLPTTRDAVVHRFKVGGHKGYITAGLYEDGSPGEIFINMAKEGSTVSGLMDNFAICVSLMLQSGQFTVEDLVDRFKGSRYEPSGWTDNENIPFTTSITDYIFRWLEDEFVEGEIESVESIQLEDKPEQLVDKSQLDSSANICPNCGGLMERTGDCDTCPNCGETGGCG